MKRWKIALAAAGILLLVGCGLYATGWFSADGDDATLSQPGATKAADPMDSQSGWRYRQNRPHHWRYIMLKN